MDNINDKIQLFEDKKIRTAWDEENEEWYFSIVDVVVNHSQVSRHKKAQFL